jgi:DNA-binding winged helix-turn-helix (wHTH) protein/TolB-like protein/tetratricopeptide (TPR) repeat protein
VRGSYVFGRFGLSADGTLLLRDGVRVALAPKVLQTLLVLVQRAGQVVRKADLLQAVWPDSFVEETGLTRNISLLRQALADDGQTLIVTVARIGYRFSAAARLVDTPLTPSPQIDEAPRHQEGQGELTGSGPAAAFAAYPTARLRQAKEAGRHRSNEQGSQTATEHAGSIERPDAGDQRAAPALTRLLILPFRLLREDPDTGFLAFSVPDAVVNALSGLKSLVVRSSTAASRFSGEIDLKRIAAEADVDAVVTGSLVRSGHQIRVSAQLLAVPCGTVLWSQSLEVTLRDIFELQDQLVMHIVNSLSLSLTTSEQGRLQADVPNSPAAYEFFLRANESIGPQGIASSSNLRVARELYVRAVEADPRFAPAWARLGRCHYLIGKADENPHQNLARAESCFQKALALSPDLPLAHNLYALVEIDRGRARDAMARLVSRGLAGSAEPELYAALVQACRFCGLLEASVAAHQRARELDSTIATGGYQALWQLGEEDRSLREGIRPHLLKAMVTGMRGDAERAIEMLRDLESQRPTTLLQNLIASLRAVFERRPDAAFEHAKWVFDANTDPESLYFVGRFIACFGDRRALPQFARALDGGFVIYRVLLRDDPWLDPLRPTREFQCLVQRSRQAYLQCLKAYVDAGGERLLGPVPGPEELEGRVRTPSPSPSASRASDTCPR